MRCHTRGTKKPVVEYCFIALPIGSAFQPARVVYYPVVVPVTRKHSSTRVRALCMRGGVSVESPSASRNQGSEAASEDKYKKSRHIVLSFGGARRGSGLGAAAWILWLRNEYGIFEKVSYGGCVLKNASAMIAEREALRKGIEHLTVLFPTIVSSFDFQVENSGRTVQYKLNAQSLRLFGLHSDVNDARLSGANRLQNKQSSTLSWTSLSECVRS